MIRRVLLAVITVFLFAYLSIEARTMPGAGLPDGSYLSNNECDGCTYQDGWLTCEKCDKYWKPGELWWHGQTSVHAEWCRDDMDIMVCGGVLYCANKCP